MNLLGTLTQLEASYHEFMAGMPLDLNKLAAVDTNASSVGIPRLIQLKSQLLLLAIPGYVKTPVANKARPGETVTALLARLIDEAKNSKDYPLCERIRQAQALLARYNGSRDIYGNPRGMPAIAPAANRTGLQDYLGAQQEILAGQFMLAAVSLQKAVMSGDEVVPVMEAGRQLDELKQNHPADYDQGLAEFLKIK